MNKEFIPYKQALALKELGFNKPCFGSWYFNPSIHKLNEEELQIIESYYFGLPEYCILAPTFSQAFRWFRKKYKLYHNIKMFGDWDNPQFSYIVSGRTMTNPAHMWHYEDKNSYEEAELACLTKLIEIVNSSKLPDLT